MQFVLHLFKIPNLRIGILFQIENLILLVAPHHVDGCFQCRALFLLHEKRSVRAAEQPCRTGDHFEAVTGGLLAGVVDGQNADAVLVGKLLELADDLIITGVAKEKINLFMKGQDADLDSIYDRFGVDYDLLSLLMHREKDAEGNFKIRWGEQKIA